MSDEEPIPVHSEIWNQRKLIERILSRHVYVLSDVGGYWPSFIVQEKEDSDIHDAVANLNQHITKLDWAARLHPDEPWLIEVLPSPTRQFPSYSVPIVMWILAIFTTLYAGENWISNGRPEGGWFFNHQTLDALVGYTIPILGAIIIASFVQRNVASKYGVHMPHLFPLFGPTALWWPFGLIGFSSMPRSDARLWPDRSSMGNTALSAPLAFIIIGLLLIFVGIELTPLDVALTAAPLGLDLPLLPNLLSLAMNGETEMILKSAWAHPFTFAGSTLMFMGWIALLPIPTMPGGRIIIARMGIAEARTGATQIMLIMMVMLFGFLFGAFNGWTIWSLPVALLFALLVHRGGDPRAPVLLDDMKGLPDEDHRRIGMLLFLAFMFALPGHTPFMVLDDWDDSLEYSVSHEDIVIDEFGWANQSIRIDNPSLIEQSWSLADVAPTNWETLYLCPPLENPDDEPIETCSGIIGPKDFVKIELQMNWQGENTPTREDFIVEYDGGELSYTASPEQMVFPATSTMNWTGSLEDPQACFDLVWNGAEESNLSVLSTIPSELLNFEGSSNSTISVTDEVSEICVKGRSGMLDLAEGVSIDGVEYEMTITSTNYVPLHMPNGEMTIDPNHLGWTGSFALGGELRMQSSGPCEEVITSSVPNIPEEGDWIWDLSVLTVGVIPVVESQNLTLKANVGDVILHCLEDGSHTEYVVIDAPNLILEIGENNFMQWQGNSINSSDQFRLYNPTSSNISIVVDHHGNGPQWNVSTNLLLSPSEWTSISISPQGGDFTMAWLEHSDWIVELHLASHEV
ncbi:MAG: M50 family metallopeptidase [Candidatus Poseidoniaceae archaeon]|nr:M50 family metallopeptidase [Candidatus Poseidoniaceae archaeon]